MMFKEYLEKLDMNVFQINFQHPDYYHIENNVILYEYIKDNYERVIVTYDYSDVGYIDGSKVVHLTDFLIE